MRKLLLTLALLLPAAAFAQTTYEDGLSFGARATVEADAKLAKGLHLSAHEQFRYYGGSEDIMRFYTGIGLEYKVLPFLKVGAEYELINRCKYDETVKANAWSIRHRGNFFLTGTLKTPDWQFGLKETLRLTHRPGDMNTLQSPRNADSRCGTPSTMRLIPAPTIPRPRKARTNTRTSSSWAIRTPM